jgi:GcrA cell cycle regulator
MPGAYNDVYHWSDDRIATLKKLYADGHSASQIAKLMPGVLSRNAVIGKLHRLGLTAAQRQRIPSPPPLKAPPVAKAKLRPELSVTRLSQLGMAKAEQARHVNDCNFQNKAKVAEEPRAFAPASQEPSGKPARIIDKHFGGCRWPINAPTAERGEETLFCCGEREPGETYCRQHKPLAYSKANNPLGKKAATTNELIRSLRRYAA